MFAVMFTWVSLIISLNNFVNILRKSIKIIAYDINAGIIICFIHFLYITNKYFCAHIVQIMSIKDVTCRKKMFIAHFLLCVFSNPINCM